MRGATENNSLGGFPYAQIFLHNAHAAERKRRVEGQNVGQMREPRRNLPIGAGR